MTDNDLIKLFLPIIQAGLTADGYTTVLIKQAYQPTQQGIDTQPTVYFYKKQDHRYGFTSRIDSYDSINNNFIQVESQLYESTFQISSLVLQDPSNTNTFTASDLVNEVAAILGSQIAIQTLQNSGVGILRITDVGNSYFVDDRDNFEAIPMFDFVLEYARDRITTVPVIDLITPGIYRI